MPSLREWHNRCNRGYIKTTKASQLLLQFLKQGILQTKTELLLQQLAAVEQFAKATKLQRLLKNPYKYSYAILFRELWYKQTKKSKAVLSNTFFSLE